MDRKSKYDLPSDAREYNAEHWLIYGMVTEPNTREKLLALTIEEMVRIGPSEFSAKTVCDRIDAKYALVNYYFGDKKKLIAEASLITYKKHIHQLMDAVRKSDKDPEKRLRTLLRFDLEWHRSMNSWALLFNYPLLSNESRVLIETNFGSEIHKYFEFFLAIMGQLVLDLRRGKPSDFDFDETNYPRAQLLAHPKVVFDSVSIVYSSHGLNIWAAGNHPGSANVGTAEFTQKLIIEHHINRMVDLAKAK